MFLRLVFEQRGESVKRPSVKFLVPTLTPVSSLTVLGLSNFAQVTDSDATNLVIDAPLNDVLGERVQEVVFASGQLLTGTKRTPGWAVLTLGLVVETFEEAEVVVLGIVLDTLLLPRHGGARVVVAVFSVAGWIGVFVSALACFVPTGERLSKFFENSLTGLRM